MLDVTGDAAENILRRAMEVVNATPAVLLDLCDRLNAVLFGRASPSASSPRPVISVRQKPLDDAVADARRRVMDVKDSMEACAAKWIERNRKEGLSYGRLPVISVAGRFTITFRHIVQGLPP